MKFYFGIVAFFILFLAVFAVNAEEAAYIRENLNKNFAGQLIHPGDRSNSRDVLITVLSVETDKDGLVTAIGRGEFYGDGQETKSFDFRWKINPDTLHFEMSEKTSGEAYIGNISKGLDSIEAERHPSKGKLVLYSVVQINP